MLRLLPASDLERSKGSLAWPPSWPVVDAGSWSYVFVTAMLYMAIHDL